MHGERAGVGVSEYPFEGDVADWAWEVCAGVVAGAAVGGCGFDRSGLVAVAVPAVGFPVGACGLFSAGGAVEGYAGAVACVPCGHGFFGVALSVFRHGGRHGVGPPECAATSHGA